MRARVSAFCSESLIDTQLVHGLLGSHSDIIEEGVKMNKYAKVKGILRSAMETDLERLLHDVASALAEYQNPNVVQDDFDVYGQFKGFQAILHEIGTEVGVLKGLEFLSREEIQRLDASQLLASELISNIINNLNLKHSDNNLKISGMIALTSIPARAAMVMFPQTNADDAREDEPEFKSFLLKLHGPRELGPNKIPVIKLIRQYSGVGLKEAKDISEDLPYILEGKHSYAEAKEARKEFCALGIAVDLLDEAGKEY